MTRACFFYLLYNTTVELNSLVLGNGDWDAGVEVRPSDLLEVECPQHSAEDHVEELDTVAIVHQVGEGDGDGDRTAIGLTSAGTNNTLRRETCTGDRLQGMGYVPLPGRVSALSWSGKDYSCDFLPHQQATC